MKTAIHVIIILILVLHHCAIKNKYKYLEAILFYYKNQDQTELYKRWIDKKNEKKLTVIDICSQKGDKKMVSLIYKEYEQLNLDYDFSDGRNNVFHFISKNNDIYHLVININSSYISMRNLLIVTHLLKS